MNAPIAYFLLQSKKQSTYEIAFNSFKLFTKTTFRPWTKYIMDFEKAEINSVKKCFMRPGDSIQLCYFHFTQMITRHFQTYAKTKLNRDFQYLMNMLPFISVKRVYEVINELKKHNDTLKFATYFDQFVLKNYDVKDWNITTKEDKETITNNVVESHNNTLRKEIGEKPSLLNFMENLSILENKYYEGLMKQKGSANEKERITEEEFNQKFRRLINKIMVNENREKSESDLNTYTTHPFRENKIGACRRGESSDHRLTYTTILTDSIKTQI